MEERFREEQGRRKRKDRKMTANEKRLAGVLRVGEAMGRLNDVAEGCKKRERPTTGNRKTGRKVKKKNCK